MRSSSTASCSPRSCIQPTTASSRRHGRRRASRWTRWCACPRPTFPGCVIPVRVLAVFRTSDEAGQDDKLLCVPFSDPNWSELENLEDLPAQLRSEIEHFFSIYKMPEGKEVEVHGWEDREVAERLLDEARGRFGLNNRRRVDHRDAAARRRRTASRSRPRGRPGSARIVASGLADVRGDQRARLAPQRMAVGERLRVGDVERRPGDRAARRARRPARRCPRVSRGRRSRARRPRASPRARRRRSDGASPPWRARR